MITNVCEIPTSSLTFKMHTWLFQFFLSRFSLQGSEPCEKLSQLLSSTRLTNDLKMSPKQQTSRIEAFHCP